MSMGLVDITMDSDSESALEEVVNYLMLRFPLWDEQDLIIRKLPNQQMWRLRVTVETMEQVMALSGIRLI